MDLLCKDIEEGGFYYTSSNIDPPQVASITWYLKDGLLRSPTCYRDVREGNNWFFKPIALEDICLSEPGTCRYEEWITKHGDIQGRLAWENYKAKLRMKDMERKEEEGVKMDNDVDLYDSKFVYFDWKDRLVGMKGFYADNMGLIMSTIRENGVIQKGTLIKFGDNNAPFVVQPLEEGEDPASWRFFYYDPHYEVKWAYFKEGKTVQFRQNPTYPWKDVLPYPKSGYDPDFFNGGLYEFRIKPEEQKPINVDVKVNNTPSSDNKIKITINGKECIFENAEQARMVLQGN